jgi:hypothetical protein
MAIPTPMKCEQCGHENKSFHRSGAIARWKDTTPEFRSAEMRRVQAFRNKSGLNVCCGKPDIYCKCDAQTKKEAQEK